MKTLPLHRLMRQFWVMVDQAVFALSNFILNVAFARWLSPHDYGLFSVSFSGFLLLNVIHYGCILEPLLVLSPQIKAISHRSYVISLGRLHATLLIAITAISIMVLWITGQTEFGWGIFGATVGGMAMLTLVTARRLCLVFLTPRSSALIGSLYFAGVVVTGYIVAHWLAIGWLGLWVVMGGWSLICALVILALLLRKVHGNAPYSVMEILHFQKDYAPLALLASLAQWLNTEGVYLIMAQLIGLTAVAQTRAVFNLINPLTQITIAMHMTWLVGFSDKHARGEQNNLFAVALPYAALFATASIVLTFVGHPLVNWLYAGKYVSAAWQLPLFCACIGMTGLMAMITSVFKARGMLWQGMAPTIAAGLLAVVLGSQLISWIGQPGMAFALVTANTLGFLIALSLIRRSRVILPITSR